MAKLPSLEELAQIKTDEKYRERIRALAAQKSGPGGFTVLEGLNAVGEGVLQAGYGAGEVIREGARGAVGGGIELLDLLGITEDGTADRFWESSRRLADRRNSDIGDFRDWVGETNPFYEDNGSDGGDVIREISAALTGAAIGGGMIKGTQLGAKALGAINQAGRGTKFAASIPAAYGADSLSYSATLSDQDKLGIGNVAEQMGYDNALAVDLENDSDNEMRLKRGTEGALAAALIGAGLIAGPAAARKLLGKGGAATAPVADTRSMADLLSGTRVDSPGASDMITGVNPNNIRFDPQTRSHFDEATGRNVINDNGVYRYAPDLGARVDAAPVSGAAKIRDYGQRRAAETASLQEALARGSSGDQVFSELDQILGLSAQRSVQNARANIQQAAERAMANRPKLITDQSDKIRLLESRYPNNGADGVINVPPRSDAQITPGLRQDDILNWLDAGVAGRNQIDDFADLNSAAGANGKKKDLKYAADDIGEAGVARAQEISTRAAKILEANGVKGVTVKTVQGLIDGVARGSYDVSRKVLTVSLSAKNPIAVLDHEIVHAVFPAIPDAQRNALIREGKKWMAEYGIAKNDLYKGLDEASQIEEAIARRMQDISAGKVPKPDGIIAGALASFRKFFTRLGNAIRGAGFKTADDLLNDIRAGKPVGKGGDRVGGVRYAASTSSDAEPNYIEYRRDDGSVYQRKTTNIDGSYSIENIGVNGLPERYVSIDKDGRLHGENGPAYVRFDKSGNEIEAVWRKNGLPYEPSNHERLVYEMSKFDNIKPDPKYSDARFDSERDIIDVMKTDGVAEKAAEEIAAGMKKNFAKEDWGTVLGMFSAVTNRLMTVMSMLKEAVKNPGQGGKALFNAAFSAVQQIRNTIIPTAHGALKGFGYATGSAIPGKLADMVLHTRLGGGTTYWEGIERTRRSMSSRINHIFEPFSRDEAARLRIAEIIERFGYSADVSMGDIQQAVPGATWAERQAARDAAFWFRDYYDLIRTSGVNIGDQGETYFHAMSDHGAILKNPELFEQKAKEAFILGGADEVQAEKLAKAWYLDVHSGRNNYVYSDRELIEVENADGDLLLLKQAMEKTRTFTKEQRDILKDFYVRDPVRVMAYYNNAMSKRVWFEQLFGKGKLQEMFKQFRADVAGTKYENEIGDFQNLVENILGIQKINVSPRARTTLSWIHTLGSITLMEHSVISSLMEPFVIGVRTNSVMNGVRAMGYTIEALVRRGKTNELRDVAEFIGIISNDLADSAAMQRINPAMNDYAANRMSSEFMRLTFQSQYAEATRLGLYRVADRYFWKMVEQAEKGSKVALRDLQQLGVRYDLNSDLFRDLKDLRARGITVENLKSWTSVSEEYMRAVNRLVNESSMLPNNATRPAWANTPYGRIVFALMSYTYAFQKQVINRTAQKAWEGITEKGLTVGERLALVGPALQLVSILPVLQGGVGYIRNALTNPGRNEEMDFMTFYNMGLSRAGVYGMLDKPMNIVSSARYEADLATSLTGPFLGGFLGIGDSVINYYNNNNDGNNDERALAKKVWEFPINAALNAGMTYMPGGRYIDFARSAGLFAMGFKQPRDEFMNIVAGAKE